MVFIISISVQRVGVPAYKKGAPRCTAGYERYFMHLSWRNPEPPLSGHSRGTSKGPCNRGWPLIEVCQVCRKFSYSLAETSLQKTNARGGKHYWSDPQSVAIFYHIFLHHILEIIIKPKKVYQALDSRQKLVVKGSCGRLIEVIMGELSLGR